MRGWMIFGLAVVMAAGLTGCVNREAQKQAKRTEALLAETQLPVTVTSPKVETLTELEEITGQISTSQDVTVGAKVAGRIVAVYIKEGDPVRIGQTIASQDTSSLEIALRQAQAQYSQASSALQQALTSQAINPAKSRAAVASAEAALRSAKAQLAKAQNGARSEEVKQAESSVSAAKSNMETARREMERQKALLKEGAVSQQAVDAAENAYQAALSNYESALENLNMKRSWTRPEDITSAQEAVRQAQESLSTAQSQKKLDAIFDQQVDAARSSLRSAQAQVDLARKNLADAQITSPVSGQVAGSPIQPGAFAAPGTPIVRIIGSGSSYFEGEVPEVSLMNVHTGDQVRVKLDALPDLKLTGRIAAVNPLGDSVGRLFKVRVQLDVTPPQARPGMFARGSVDLRSIPNALTLPSYAILREGSKSYVFVIQGNTAKKSYVTLGLTKDSLVQVTGIEVNSQVVIKGQNQLVDGSKVKIEKPEAKASDSDKVGG